MNQKRESKNRTAKVIVALVAGIAVITLIAAAVNCDNKRRDEQNRQAYAEGWARPWTVTLDLAEVNFDAKVECHKMGLDKDECPQSDGETSRRVMATLMTQTIERNGVAWRGMAYVPETIRAMNHQFYDLILWLEENQCAAGTGTKDTSGVLAPPGPKIYSPTFQETRTRNTPSTYYVAEILEQLREAQFIYKCGQGWGITTEWLNALEN